MTSLTDRSAGERIYEDDRTWRDRLRACHTSWKEQLPLLVNAYLRHKYPVPHEGLPPEVELTGTIKVLDLYTLAETAEYSVISGQRTAEALIAAGYLPNSPSSPTMAISIKTLELLRSLRLFKASFSTEAFAKLVCHYYYVRVLHMTCT